MTPTTHHVALVKAYYQSLPINQPGSHITHLKYILPPCLLNAKLKRHICFYMLITFHFLHHYVCFIKTPSYFYLTFQNWPYFMLDK